jgi:hypothetical protein
VPLPLAVVSSSSNARHCRSRTTSSSDLVAILVVGHQELARFQQGRPSPRRIQTSAPFSRTVVSSEDHGS